MTRRANWDGSPAGWCGPHNDSENEMTRHLLLAGSLSAVGLGFFAFITPTILSAQQAPTAPQSPPTVSGPAAAEETPDIHGKSDNVEWVKTAIAAPVHTAPSISTSIVTYYPPGTRLGVQQRQSGWVEVTDPATNKGGWVYEAYLVALDSTPSNQANSAPSTSPESSSSLAGQDSSEQVASTETQPLNAEHKPSLHSHRHHWASHRHRRPFARFVLRAFSRF
jgi:hypothetical protein